MPVRCFKGGFPIPLYTGISAGFIHCLTWISYRAGSPARKSLKPIHMPKECKAKKAGGAGTTCTEYVGYVNPATSLLKIAPGSSAVDSSKYLQTLPTSGMIQSGSVYRVPPLECNRVGVGYILLPTPIRSARKGCARNRYFGSPTYRGFFHEFIRDGEQDPIYPNPELMEALMGFPILWTGSGSSGSP